MLVIDCVDIDCVVSRTFCLRGRARGRSGLSKLAVGLAARDVSRDWVAEGSGRTSSEALLNLLISSLNEVWRDLATEAAGGRARVDELPNVGESDADAVRYAEGLVRDGPSTLAGDGDTLSPVLGYPVGSMFTPLVASLASGTAAEDPRWR